MLLTFSGKSAKIRYALCYGGLVLSILEELYNSSVNPHESHISNSEEYKRLNKKLSDDIEKFVQTLNKQQRHAFERIEACAAKLNAVAEKDRYIAGVRAGAQMMLEMLEKGE